MPVGNEKIAYQRGDDFRRLINPRVIASEFPGLLVLISKSQYDSQKRYIYVSTMIEKLPRDQGPIMNIVYKINLKALTKEEIWTNDLVPKVKYGRY